jgi:hypothetical protein
MKKEFIVQRQGRSFVLYAGLLDLSHQHGLKSIDTELIQAPSPTNGKSAICRATAIFEQDGVERRYTGIGDASPENVAPAMAACVIRMAETRAKARALRDAVNVDAAPFEELGEEESVSIRPVTVIPEAASAQAPAPPPRLVDTGRSGTTIATMTPAQQTAIISLTRRAHISVEELVRERFGEVPFELLSDTQASELIRHLNERNSSRVVSAA